MATISENLNSLQDTKTRFKNVFTNKGVDVSDTPFTQYPEKMAEIKTDCDENQINRDYVKQNDLFAMINGETITDDDYSNSELHRIEEILRNITGAYNG